MSNHLWLIIRLIHCLIDRLTGWLTDRQIDRLIDSFIGWLERLVVRMRVLLQERVFLLSWSTCMTTSCNESSTSVPNHMFMAQHHETTTNFGGAFRTPFSSLCSPNGSSQLCDWGQFWHLCNAEENSVMTGLSDVIWPWMVTYWLVIIGWTITGY